MLLQAGVHRFGFEREYGEDRFVDAPQGFAGHSPLEGFDAERVFAQGQ